MRLEIRVLFFKRKTACELRIIDWSSDVCSSDLPANQVCAAATVARYDDEAALARFAAAVDVVTFEFENIPLATVEVLQALVPLRPGATVLSIFQHRLREKEFCNNVR